VPARDWLAVAVRLAWLKTRAGRVWFIAPAALLAVVAFAWVRSSYETAMKFFLSLFPYLFLFLGADMVRSEAESGALESGLFLGGRFRAYLLLKGPFLAAVAAAVSLVMFAGLSLAGLGAGRPWPPDAARFGLGLVAGVYYIALAGLLSTRLRAGSNVLVVVIAQAAALLLVMFTLSSRAGLLNAMETGVWPDFKTRLEFMAAAALIPNLVLTPPLYPFCLELLVLTAMAFVWQRSIIRRMELGKP
jgi:hypothetical protein